jgi:putative ABC transport system permease protein
MNRILGADYINEIDLQVGDGADLESVQTRIEQLLRRRHKLRDDEDNDFHVANMAEMVEAAQSVTGVFTLLLSAVAAISLVVGGIGIMNIMLVTVTERTREIGIRKAIGAKDRDILVQFLLEAIVMSTLGGLIGILAGVSTAKAGTMITGFPTVVSSVSIALALTFSLSVGIFFGFYPARRAAAMDPVEALSYE